MQKIKRVFYQKFCAFVEFIQYENRTRNLTQHCRIYYNEDSDFRFNTCLSRQAEYFCSDYAAVGLPQSKWPPQVSAYNEPTDDKIFSYFQLSYMFVTCFNTTESNSSNIRFLSFSLFF